MGLIFDERVDEVLKQFDNCNGQDYFNLLAARLADLTEADHVMVCELHLAAHTAESIVLWSDGNLSPNICYNLSGTPCDQVNGGGTCIYPRDISELFPEDRILIDLGLQGYVGRSLKDRSGQPIGLMVALFKQPDYATEEILSIFDLFAVRAQAELERIQWEGSLHAKIELLEEKNRQLDLSRRVFEHTNEGMIVTDSQNIILDVNDAFLRMSGYSKVELVGKNPSIINSGLQPETFYQQMWQVLSSKGVWQGELWNRRKDGSIYPIMSSISMVRNADGHITNYIASCKDTSSEKELKEQLYRQATHDYLTGLSNSFEFSDHANKAIALAQLGRQQVALLRMNIDNLRLVNSSYGYMAGDIVVKTIGQRLKNKASGSDILARLGGDDFALLIGYEQLSNLEKQLRLMLDQCCDDIDAGGDVVHPSCSVGISILDEDARDLESMMSHSFYALQHAKENCRGSYSFYNQGLEQQTRRHEVIQKRLFAALTEGKVEPYYQPIVSLHDMKVHHCEALARWHDDVLGLVSPAEFIPVAESTGLIKLLGQQIMSRSVRDFSELNRLLSQPIGVAINRSPVEFNFNNDADEVIRFAESCGLNPELVCIEITESLMIEAPDEALKQLQLLKSRGFKLALDDFGTGFSSLSYIKHYPFDYLKIDQSFITDLARHTDDYILVKTIIQMARNLGLKTIAEGVETEQQCVLLQELGCDFGQGYLFSRPLQQQKLIQFMEQSI